MRREVHHETAFRAREEAKNERANAQARGRNEEEREKTRPPAARCDSIFVVASRNVGRAAFVVVSYRIVSFRFVSFVHRWSAVNYYITPRCPMKKISDRFEPPRPRRSSPSSERRRRRTRRLAQHPILDSRAFLARGSANEPLSRAPPPAEFRKKREGESSSAIDRRKKTKNQKPKTTDRHRKADKDAR